MVASMHIGGASQMVCAICLEEIDINSTACGASLRMPCSCQATLHAECLAAAGGADIRSCPVCRQEFEGGACFTISRDEEGRARAWRSNLSIFGVAGGSLV